MEKKLKSTLVLILFLSSHYAATSQIIRDTSSHHTENQLEQDDGTRYLSSEIDRLYPTVTKTSVKRPLAINFKINAAMIFAGVTNIGAEIQVGSHYSIDLPFIYSPYTVNRNYKMRILAVQPELRYWLGTPLDGHFVGVHIHLAGFNVATGRQNRYQDSRMMYGIGASYGYTIQLDNKWGVELNIGAGYANIGYRTYDNVVNGAQIEPCKIKHYVGITRAGFTFVYKLRK